MEVYVWVQKYLVVFFFPYVYSKNTNNLIFFLVFSAFQNNQKYNMNILENTYLKAWLIGDSEGAFGVIVCRGEDMSNFIEQVQESIKKAIEEEVGETVLRFEGFTNLNEYTYTVLAVYDDNDSEGYTRIYLTRTWIY